MFPVIFRVGPVQLYSYGLMLALALLAGMAISTAEGKRRGIDGEKLSDFFLATAVVSVLSARLLHVALNWNLYAGSPWQVLSLWEGGLSIHGGVAGGMVAGWWFARRQRVPFLVLADATAPGLALGTAIGRLGCFLNGCCFGVLTAAWWGTRTRYAPGLRHPTQLYEMVLTLGLFAFLWSRRLLPMRSGRLFFMYVAGYAAIRLVVEAFREVEGYLGPLTYAQVLSLVLLVVAVAFLGRTRGQHG